MSEVLRIATFNVHHCRGRDGRVDVERTARVLRGTGARIVALQEVDRGVGRSGRVDQVKDLGAALDLRMFFWPTLELEGGDYGLAFGSDLPFEAHGLSLPRLGSEEPRGAIVAEVGGATFVCTHLSTRARVRAAGLEHLLSELERSSGQVVVAGDLNATPSQLGALRRAGFVADRARRPTAGRGPLARQIDHIWVRGGRVASSFTGPAGASDHRPLVADLLLPL